MHFTEERLRKVFDDRDLDNGRAYYAQGRVRQLQIQRMEGYERFDCVVQGQKPYHVSIRIHEGDVSIRCSCPQFEKKHLCKHIAAAMLAYESQREDPAVVKSDYWVQDMLKLYTERSVRQTQLALDRPVRLVPRLHPGYGGYPSFSFQVGCEKLYVVQDVKKFVENVLHRETVSYGKSLKFCHAPEQFDQDTQKIIALLMDQFVIGRTMAYTPYTYHHETASFSGHQKRQIILTGRAFDQFFDLFQDKTVAPGNGKQGYIFAGRDPEVTLSLEKQGGAAKLQARMEEGAWSFFGSPQNLYALGPGWLLRCSQRFREAVYPLLENGTQWMTLALSDLPTFCGCVLPEIQDSVNIEDPEELLQEYLPEECVPCFYFDIEDNLLSLEINFRYDTVLFSCFEEPEEAVKRDLRTEQTALAFVEERMRIRKENRFIMAAGDAVYDFLLEELEKFQELGEVYLTDRLREKQIQPSRSVVGISVSDGSLLMDFDTGGFPPEELESLYQSLLKRRRYHKLPDGRYLPLEGSAWETLAEMAHILQLSPKELKQGQVKLPAFRALYLDSVLSGREDIQIRKDQWFRELIRNFKSVPESSYALPEGLEDVLRPYQKEGFQWLKTLSSYGFGGILADEMGLGKTLQMIAFLASLDPAEQCGPSLIVCPASLILNWADELDKFAPELTYTLIMGTAKERAAQIAAGEGRNVWVTSYELLRQDIERYAPLQFTCCVLDEAQHIKNQSTLASKAVKRIDCRQRFVLTGTPIENRLSELWNLFDFLMPGYLFSHSGFVQNLEKPAVKSKDAEAMEQLRRLVRPFLLRRMKQDVLKELPPKLEYIRGIPLSEAEKKVYYASSAAARKSLTGGEGGKLAILAALTELRQICCAPDLRFENYTGPCSKLEACMELCAGMAENGHQILLFSQFTSMLDRIRARLDAMNISHFTLQGSTPKAKRAQLVKAFNAGGASVFLISLKAGGTGLNLTAADVVIHYDPWWNPAAQEQATGRAHRLGQRASVQVYKLIAKDTIEEKILALQSRKAELMDAVTDGGGNGILDMSREELLALFD